MAALVARIAHLLTIPCELIQRTYAPDPDGYGDQVATEVVTADVLCELQQAGSREDSADAIQIATYRLFLDEGTPLRGWDAVRITATSEVLELDGDAFAVRSPLTGDTHVEAIVRRTDYGGTTEPAPEPPPVATALPVEAT